MADLEFIQRSSPVQVVGGDETFSTDVSPNKDLSVSDSIKSEIISGALIVGTTAIEVKVGASRLLDRKGIMLYNNSNQAIYWGGAGVTIATGIPLAKGEPVIISINDVALFVIGSQANQNARVVEYK